MNEEQVKEKQADVINIGGHILAETLEQMEKDGKYTPRQCDLIRWLHGYAHAKLDGRKSRLEKKLGYDWSVIFKIMTGTYEAGIGQFCDAILRLQRQVEEGETDFKETLVTREMFRLLDYCRDHNKLGILVGDARRGKTAALEEWAAQNNHGRAAMIRGESGCSKKTLVMKVAAAANIGTRKKDTQQLHERVFRAYSQRNILIVDEAGELMQKSWWKSVELFDFLRDLYDIRHCGLVLCITRAYLDKMRNGSMAEFFEQLLGRAKILYLPEKVLKQEVQEILTGIGAGNDERLFALAYRDANSEGRLETLYEDLRDSGKVAEAAGEKLAAKHLQAVIDRRQIGIFPKE